VDRQNPHEPGQWPTADVGAELLRRLAALDPLATTAFAEAYLAPLVAHLRANHPNADDHTRITAAEDAITSLFKKPERYTPGLRSLVGYLRMSAAGDLRNLLASEKRHHTRRENWDSVELDAAAGNSADGADDDDLPSFDDPRFGPVIAAFTPAERAAFGLMRAGNRDTADFSAVLGLTHLSADEQAGEVKRVKDRIMQRLKRAAGGSS